MARKIILLSDGTGNSSAKVWRTNVWRTFEALDLSDSDQVAYYDDGVGTSAFKPWAILGGAFGFGLRRNVLTLYKFACRNYHSPDDELFGFGFSRGAYTIRIVMGMIDSQGLVKADDEAELHSLASAAYRAYRRDRYKNLRLEGPYQRIRNKFGPDYPPQGVRKNIKIGFIGVWDTVAAYGLPVDEMARGIDDYFWPIAFPKNRKLSPNVTRACQALALDEERTTFHPELWDESDYSPIDNTLDADVQPRRFIKNERISQVWFAGVHSNVGGGYPDDSLSYIPFVWMITEARNCGLRFKSDFTSQPPVPPPGATPADPDTFKNAITRRDKDGRLYDPRKGLGGYYRYGPRKLVPHFYSPAKKGEEDEVDVGRPKIHESVFRRIQNHAHAYAPIGLPPIYDVVKDDGEIVSPDQFNIEPNKKAFESNDAAAARVLLQEHVWNEVWKRRIVYFLTVGATIWLIIFPLVTASRRINEVTNPFRWISDIIRAAGSFLPNFTSTWINGYAYAPRSTVVLVCLVIGCLIWGTSIASRTSGIMSAIWQKTPAAPKEEPRNWIYRLRGNRHYMAFHQALKRKIAPAFFALVFAYLGLAIVSHLLFNVQDVAGATCKESAELETLEVGKSNTKAINFGTTELCHATGVFVRDNRARYIVTIEPGEPWTHFGIAVPVGGFTSIDPPSWYHRIALGLAVPLRRELFEDWFRIVLRYGRVGGEEVFYEPDLRDPVIQFPIVPTRSGELFVFINDAVIGFPYLYNMLSRFNTGTAKLTIRRTR